MSELIQKLVSSERRGPLTRLRSVKAAVAGFTVLVCLVLIAGFAFDTWRDRVDAVARATENATNVVQSVGQHADSAVRGVNAILQGMADQFLADGADNAALLPRLFQTYLSALPQLKGLAYLDDQGDPVVNSLNLTQRNNVAEHDYFQYHRAHSARVAYVGKPLRIDATGDWVIPVSRRVSWPDGSFRGVMLGLLDMTYFQNFYAGFSLGENGVVTLASGNGIVLVRRPFVEANVGRDLSAGTIFKEYLPQAPQGAVWGYSLQDDLYKLAAYRRTDLYWLVVWVALEENDILQAWRAAALRSGFFTAVAVAIIALLGLFLTRQIGSRLQAESAAAESAASYRRLADTSTDMIFRLDRHFRRSYVSPASRTILGYEPEELLGLDPIAEIHPDDSGHVAAAFRAIVAGEEDLSVINRIRHRDGRWVWVEVRLRPISDQQMGAPVEIFGSMRDITRRKRADEALAEAEARARSHSEFLEDAIEALPDGFVVYSADTRKAMTNRRYREMHARNPRSSDPNSTLAESLREAARLGDLKVPDGMDIEAWIQRRLESHRRGETDYMRPAFGRWIRILERRTRDGRIVGIHSDITDLKEAQAAAERASQAKSDFLSHMSHELRTPLNAIIGFSQLLQIDRGGRLAPEQKEQVDHIYSGGKHLLKLINEVLDLSSIETGRLTLLSERVMAAAMLADVRQTMAPLAQQAGLTLVESGGPVDAAVRADPLRLRQILLNLASNAVKYNRQGGRVELGVSRVADGRVRFTVKDTGKGIPPERQAELFQPFQRLGAERSGIEGAGIGLAIARRLTEAMGGSIGFDSVAGEGTCFWVDLPADSREATAGAVAPGEIPSYGTLRGCTVLYVEDDPDSLKLVETLLSAFGRVSFLSAPTPQLGLELAASHQPDVIILDINLPGMNGFEVLARLQAMPETWHIPVLALTTAARPRDVQAGLAAGFCHYLTKPIDVELFVAAIAQVLESIPPRRAAAGD